MELILASANQHKAMEFVELLDDRFFRIQPADKKIDVDETGDTYHENALLKAQTYFDHFKRPVFSDDSGLNVDALPDDLGVCSARFGGEGLSSMDQNKLLLDKLDGVPLEKRKAYFSCVLCFYLAQNEIYFFEGRVDGYIDTRIQGEHGFGYDPVFIPNEYLNERKTLAMIPEWKRLNSHRARASVEANIFFSQRICQR